MNKVFRVMFTFTCMLSLKLTALLLVPVHKTLKKKKKIPFYMTLVCHTCMFQYTTIFLHFAKLISIDCNGFKPTSVTSVRGDRQVLGMVFILVCHLQRWFLIFMLVNSLGVKSHVGLVHGPTERLLLHSEAGRDINRLYCKHTWKSAL